MSAKILLESFEFIVNWIEGQQLPVDELNVVPGDDTGEKETFNLQLNPGAGQQEIEELEALLERRLPQDLRELLSFANGQSYEFQDSDLDWIPGTALLSTQDIAKLWLQGKEWYTDDGDLFNSYDDRDRIRRVLWHENRIPVWGRMDPDEVAEGIIDGVPGPKGESGQLIMAVSECDFQIIGSSLSDFFEKYAKLIREEQLVIRQGSYGHSVEPVSKAQQFDNIERLFR